MPQYSERIFHDRQVVGSTSPFLTSSNTFIDVPDATLITKDLSQEATYSSSLSLLVAGSLNNTTATFRGTLNGSPFGSEVPINLRNKDADVGYTILGVIGGVAADSEIKLQCKTDSGTLTIVEFAVLIDGIPDSRVI